MTRHSHRSMPASPGDGGGDATLAAAVGRVLGAGQASVVWTDCGDELVVHAGRVTVRRERDAIVVHVPVATEETGPAVLSIPILLGGPDGGGITDARPWGQPELADRWGTLLQDAVWAGVAERGEI